MKIKVMPQDLVKEITICQRAISNRTTMQVLECIHFQAQGEGLLLSSTDLELSIETFLPCRVEEEGIMVVPANLIGNIFKKLPPDMTTMEEKEGTLTIDCGKIHYSLQVPNAGEFPALPELEEGKVTHLDNVLIKKAIKETEFATSTDESKISLTGIFLERKEEGIRFVSLDGYRMALRELDLDPEEASFSAIVPKRALIELSRIIPEEGRTSLRLLPGHIYFESGSLSMFSRLIDKNYIRYEEIISKDHATRVHVNRQAFQEALERSSLLVREERTNLIKLHFIDSSIHIASNSEIGSVHEQVEAEIEGEEVRIAFNSRYILDGVRALDTESLQLDMNGSLNPMMIYPGGEEEKYLYLVLPVRVAGE